MTVTVGRGGIGLVFKQAFGFLYMEKELQRGACVTPCGGARGRGNVALFSVEGRIRHRVTMDTEDRVGFRDLGEGL